MLACGVLAAANASPANNVRALAYPLLALFTPGHSGAWRGGYLLLLLALAALWVVMQRDQIGGGGFMAFVRSLPFTERNLRRVNVAVLVLADTPLLLMQFCALFVVTHHGAAAANVLVLCDVAGLALLVQLCVLERRFGSWPFIVLACLALGATTGTRGALPVGILAGAGICFFCITLPRVGVRWQRAGRLLPSALAAACVSVTARLPPAWLLSWRILYRERGAETGGKALVAASISGAALALMAVFAFDGRAFPLALIAQGCIVLSISGLYQRLHASHCASAAYFGALPLRQKWWRWYDTGTLVAFALPFLVLLAATAWWQGAVPSAAAASGVLSFAWLLAALRLPQLGSSRHAVVLSTITTGLWIAGTIRCLT